MKITHYITREAWNALCYPAVVQRASDEDSGGFYAWIPLLGRGLFMADGETATEALDNLEGLRRENYDLVIESGRPIPLPDEEEALSPQPYAKRETIAA